MKKFKTAMAALLAAAALANLTGCSENAPKNENQSSALDSNQPNNAGNASNLNYDKTDCKSYAPILLTDNNTENSIRLFDSISIGKENAMFSPISLNMALGLIEAGAKGETKAALDSYLQTENFTDFMENYMKLAREKYSSEDKYGDWKNVLEIANSLWADNSVPLKDEYQKTMTKRLEAEIKNVSFADTENTLKEINGWVNDKTHKMIPKVLENIDSDTAAVLINTVYFESAWRDRWFLNSDFTKPFTLPDGTTKEIPLMENGSDIYFENDKATAFSCKYMNGLEFIGILPKAEGDFDLEGLDIPALLESRTDEFSVMAAMPELNFATDYDLNEALKAAGLSNIFSGSADFSGISDNSLYVTDVIQKTKLELNQFGTKASAATVISMVEGAIIDTREKKTVQLDRPFAFMIYDSAEDQILFLGKVTNP